MMELIPPSQDGEFLEHVAQTALRVPADSARRFWRSRLAFVRRRLAVLGWTEEEIEVELARFTEAVRAEVKRARAANG